MEVLIGFQITMAMVTVCNALSQPNIFLSPMLQPPFREPKIFNRNTFKSIKYDTNLNIIHSHYNKQTTENGWKPINDPRTLYSTNHPIDYQTNDRILVFGKDDSFRNNRTSAFDQGFYNIPVQAKLRFQTNQNKNQSIGKSSGLGGYSSLYLPKSKVASLKLNSTIENSSSFVRNGLARNQEKLDGRIEETISKVLKEFEGNLSRILEKAVANVNSKDTVPSESRNTAKQSEIKRIAIPENHRTSAEIYSLPQPIQSNPSISGPPSFTLIGRRAPPLADTGYISPPILNLNSNGHGNGTSDYSLEDGYIQWGPAEVSTARGVTHNPQRSLNPGQSAYKNNTKRENNTPIKVKLVTDVRLIDNTLAFRRPEDVGNVPSKVLKNNELSSKIYSKTRSNENTGEYVLAKQVNDLFDGRYQTEVSRKPELNIRREEDKFIANVSERIAKSKRNLEIDEDDRTVAETIVRDSRVAKRTPGRHTSIHVKGLSAFNPGYNSADHSPPDPFLALLLSHYGRYLPAGNVLTSQYRNLYSYLASNNIHNNKPFGAYKIYEDADG